MINLPVLNRFDITGYGMFPGTQSESGLHISILPGLTLVLGANGLGKTTLVTMLYRVLTGPYDIPSLEADTLGTTKLQAKLIPKSEKTVFAQRVADGAATASARLTLTLGGHSVIIERKLRDLQLTVFQIDGIEQALDEESFHKEISRLVGVWSFGDWILLLRHIVFYFEDRRALVWDPTAQRQLLRMLFLPIDFSRRWTEQEREILELDSRFRNFRAVLSKQVQSVGNESLKVKDARGVLAEIKSVNERQEIAVARRAKLDEEFADLESRRQSARLRLLKAEQEKEGRNRELERAKLMAVEALFPDSSESARYILAQILTSSKCLFCGHQVPLVAADLESRISAHRCVICGSDLVSATHSVERAGITDSQIRTLFAALQAMEPGIVESRRVLREAETEYGGFVRERAELDASIARDTALLDELARRLPPEEADLLKHRADLATLRGSVEVMRNELAAKRSAFKEFVQGENRSLAGKTQDIQACFDRYAKEFLFDDCMLTWSPNRAYLGQGGEAMEFPNFEVDLAGTNFPSPVRRSGPEQVSESQREFIDLAFRMALMEVAGTDRVGSLVIDAPESSLDAVFSKRAAEVLAQFAQPARMNRLIVTSNLVDGTLIPRLLALTTQGKEEGIVDLFKLAEPTRATRELQDEYSKARDRILARAKSSPGDESEAGK